MVEKLIEKEGILIPYKSSKFEDYLEKKLIEVSLPLSDARIDNTDDPLRLIRESKKNKINQEISYWADYGYYLDYTTIENKLVVDKRLLKDLSKEPDMISFYFGKEGGGPAFYIHDINKSNFTVDSEWTFNSKSKDALEMHYLINNVKGWNEFPEVIDKIVKAFSSGNSKY